MTAEKAKTSAQKLQERLRKELERTTAIVQGPGTARVGGWAKLGTALDDLMKNLLIWICAETGDRPQDLLRRLPAPQKATAGQIATVIGEIRLPRSMPAPLLTIQKDLATRGSVIFAMIAARNEVIHEGREPDPSRTTRTLQAVDQLLTRAFTE